MPEWVQNFLDVSSHSDHNFASMIWDICMDITMSLFGVTPQTYSNAMWELVAKQLYPYFLGIGAVLLNLFFLTGLIRQSINLRDNMTTEMVIELLIKVIIANFVMVQGLTLMGDILGISSALAEKLKVTSGYSIFANDLDAGAVFFYVIFGLVYIGGATISGISIVLVVLQRFLNVYMCILTAPIALSTWAGGNGLEHTAYAWIKSFLVSSFQIALIALILRLGAMMMNAPDVFNFDGTAMGFVDGFAESFISMITMFFMVAAVKSSSTWLEKTFNLH